MAKRPPKDTAQSTRPGTPPKRRRRADIVHTSVYLPEAVYKALREIAFKEECKIHDVIMEGIGLALAKRRYPPIQNL